MNVTIAEFIEILLAAVWRRRRLIVIPIMLFTALAALAVVVWPRMYTTRTLLMLQERGAADPLASGVSVTREGRLRADEIDTLLKSDRVLTSAILDINLGKKLLTQKELEGAIKALKQQLSIGVVGGEFIEIELKQSEREGIGEKLAIIMTRFFERLLNREDSMKTARQFALEQRKRDLDQARKLLEQWTERQYATVGHAGLEDADQRIADLQKQQQALESNLLRAASTVLSPPIDVTSLELALALASEQRFAPPRVQSGLPAPSQAGSQRAAALQDVEAMLKTYQALSVDLAKAEVARAQMLAQRLKAQMPEKGDAYGEWQYLDARFNEAMMQYQVHQRRAKKAAGPSSTPFGLIAPESIRIIDEPKDPLSPSTSPMKILLACIGAGIGLGIGLAALAEQLDDRVYDTRDLAGLAGVDPIIRLPRLENDTTAVKSKSVPPRRPHLAFVAES